MVRERATGSFGTKSISKTLENGASRMFRMNSSDETGTENGVDRFMFSGGVFFSCFMAVASKV